MKPTARQYGGALAGTVGLVMGGCSGDLPTQRAEGPLHQPPGAIATAVHPLGYLDDPLVLELLSGLNAGEEADAVRRQWATLRTVLGAGDHPAATVAVRSALATTQRLAVGSEGPADDAIAAQVLLLALHDAQAALSRAPDR